MGQVAPKYFYPPIPYGQSDATNALNAVQPAQQTSATTTQQSGSQLRVQPTNIRRGPVNSMLSTMDYNKLYRQ